MIDYLKQRNKNPHFNSEADFFGYTSKWLDNEASRNHINIMDGLYIGVKKTNRQPVLIEDLLGEDDIELCSKRLHGILIPEDEMLRRSAYNWFPVTSIDNLLKSNMVVTKYLRYGITEPEKEQPKIEDQSRTVVSI
jgi:hypothetical protein